MNEAERTVAEKYEKMGYDVIKDGMPDMLILKGKLIIFGGEIEFKEVKYKDGKLNRNQARAFNLLKKHGVPVAVERVPKVRESFLFNKWRERAR